MTAWMTRREYYGGVLYCTDKEGEGVTASISFDVPDDGDEVTVIMTMAVAERGVSVDTSFPIPKNEWQATMDRRLDVQHTKDLMRWNGVALPWVKPAIMARVRTLVDAGRQPREVVVTAAMHQALLRAGDLSDDTIHTPAGALPVSIGADFGVLV